VRAAHLQEKWCAWRTLRRFADEPHIPPGFGQAPICRVHRVHHHSIATKNAKRMVNRNDGSFPAIHNSPVTIHKSLLPSNSWSQKRMPSSGARCPPDSRRWRKGEATDSLKVSRCDQKRPRDSSSRVKARKDLAQAKSLLEILLIDSPEDLTKA
jgi:hypothetical protein